MYLFRTDNELEFSWEEGGVKEHLREVLEGLRAAADRSMAHQDIIRIRFPNIAERGILEVRPTAGHIFPPPIPGTPVFDLISTIPYLTLTSEYFSPFFTFEIPGVCQLLESNVLAVSVDFANGPLINQIANFAFNLAAGIMIYGSPNNLTSQYTNIRRTVSVLTKKPKITKPVDFTPIYTALFGEKIATVIMKEIK